MSFARAPSSLPQTVHALFAAQARETPSKVAVALGDDELTYEELDVRANQLAHHLLAGGVRRGDLVGLCLERSLDLVVAMLAITKAGAGYLPLELRFPPQRLAHILVETQARVVLTDRASRDALPAHGGSTICLDDHAREVAAEPSSPPPPVGGGHDVAYVLYTSGSTGNPKGVVTEHRSVPGLVKDVSYADLGPDAVLVQLGPIGFDASTLEIWGALLNGGRCVLYPDASPTVAGIRDVITRHDVTTMVVTTALFNAVVEQAPEVFAPLRELLIGGEAHSVAHVRRALAALPDTRVVNVYGPTETTTFASSFPIPRDLPASARSVPIGRAIDHARLHVLDAAWQPVEPGAIGELYIGGSGLARGYLGHPGLTAERFVPDPFGSPGERLYRTGDLVRELPGGDLDFVGRADDQLKIRGFRVEPTEVELALMGEPDVHAAAVVAAGPPQAKVLVAFVAARDGARPGPELGGRLAARLERRLPAFMVPSRWVEVEALPLNPVGKVDRQALKQRAGEEIAARSELPAGPDEATPATATETALAEMWCALLHVGAVGREDGFVELGGDSLSALSLVERIQQVFGVAISLDEFFEAESLAALADIVDERSRGMEPRSARA